jgi:hypothetical protein
MLPVVLLSISNSLLSALLYFQLLFIYIVLSYLASGDVHYVESNISDQLLFYIYTFFC